MVKRKIIIDILIMILLLQPKIITIQFDDDGYPLVPDLMSYIEAAYWYVTMKLKYPDWLYGKIS